jgi:hypothetical protein
MQFDDLKTLAFNGYIAVGERDVFLAGGGELNRKKTVRGNFAIDGSPRKLTFTKVDKDTDGGTGVWIPYVAQANVFGFLKEGHTWAASGPYSGCLFEVGVHGGRIYAAHLSRESATDRNIAAWEKCQELSGKRVLFSKKIGVFDPGQQFLLNGTAAITVASINQAKQTVSVTRLDVVTPNAGSMTGRIMGVTMLVSDRI